MLCTAMKIKAVFAFMMIGIAGYNILPTIFICIFLKFYRYYFHFLCSYAIVEYMRNVEYKATAKSSTPYKQANDDTKI